HNLFNRRRFEHAENAGLPSVPVANHFRVREENPRLAELEPARNRGYSARQALRAAFLDKGVGGGVEPRANPQEADALAKPRRARHGPRLDLPSRAHARFLQPRPRVNPSPTARLLNAPTAARADFKRYRHFAALDAELAADEVKAADLAVSATAF